MAYLPPSLDPRYSASPPPQYVGYSRPSLTKTDPDRLQALMEGYYGLGWAFAATFSAAVVLFGAAFLLGNSTPPPELLQWVVMVAALAGPLVVAGVSSYPCNKKIAYGADWKSGTAIVASILLAIGTAICGFFGFIFMQSVALGEIKKFGIKPGFFGIRKRDILARIQVLREPTLPVPPVTLGIDPVQ